MTLADAELLLASNRGPVSFREADDGSASVLRGGGGLVSGLTSLLPHSSSLWVCAALSEADRSAVRRVPDGRLDRGGYDVGGAPVRMLDIDPTTFHRAYNSVANSTLWFVHHLLYATPVQPVFDAGFRVQWQAFEDYNATFAEAIAAAAAPAAKVMVQDYHLTLVPHLLRGLRPDLRIAHFSHTPWAPADYFGLLPGEIAVAVLEGLLGADHVGFHARRWADAFLDCCVTCLHAQVDRSTSTVRHRGRTVRVGVHPLGVDGDELTARAARPDVEIRRALLLEDVADRRVIVRVDRTELSKNIVRGLLAYRELLRARPAWCGRVTHVVLAYPSRHDLPEYREYTGAVQRLGREIEDEFATASWRPIVLHVNDDYPRSLAAYRLAEVLVVNPVRDGMNLVAKEAPVLSERGCALVLSTEAGAAAELGGAALLVNPFDVSQTASALDQALSMPADQRRSMSRRLAAAAVASPPRAWFTEQVDALG